MTPSTRWRRCNGRCAQASAEPQRASSPTAASSRRRPQGAASSRRNAARCAARPARGAAAAAQHRPRARPVAHHDAHAACRRGCGAHLPEPFVEIHPDDAANIGVVDGGFARVTTDYGQCIAEGAWSASGSSAACCSRRSTGATPTPPARASARWSRRSPIRSRASPNSRRRRPRSRLTNMSSAASCCRASSSRCRRSLWWARAAVTGGYGYLFADNADLTRWSVLAERGRARRLRRIPGFRRRRLSRGVVRRRPHRDLPVRRPRA